MTARQACVIIGIVTVLLVALWSSFWPSAAWFLVPVLGLVGTGYFGYRGKGGAFGADQFAMTANLAIVKMIETKLSQGAKPGHVDILPAAKLTVQGDWQADWMKADANAW
jgi:hypothetical protein